MSEKIDIEPVEKKKSEFENGEETEGEEIEEPERLGFEFTDYATIHVDVEIVLGRERERERERGEMEEEGNTMEEEERRRKYGEFFPPYIRATWDWPRVHH